MFGIRANIQRQIRLEKVGVRPIAIWKAVIKRYPPKAQVKRQKTGPGARIASRLSMVVDLSQLYSNTFLKIIKYKHSLPIDSSTPVKTNISERKSKNKYGETEVRKICQNQKILSDDEIKRIIQGYERGLSTYKLAKQFNCHRYTIANALKKSGIEVTNQCAKKKVLAEMIIHGLAMIRRFTNNRNGNPPFMPM